ncbi:MAG: hypothetical protein V4723_03665, partial [Pseudomonadota bacterium]
ASSAANKVVIFMVVFLYMVSRAARQADWTVKSMHTRLSREHLQIKQDRSQYLYANAHRSGRFGKS